MDYLGSDGGVEVRKGARHRRFFAGAVLVFAALLAALVFGALGVFGNSDTVSAPDAITDGTLTVSTTDSAATLSNAAPGDSFYMFVSVQNTGSLNARVAVSTEVPPDTSGDPADEALSQGLFVDAEWNTFTQATCTGTANPAGATVRARGSSVVALLGSVEAGPQTGDESINAATTEALCVRYSLPLTAANSAQDGVVDINLDFNSEQTKNNGTAGQSILYGSDTTSNDLITINTTTAAGTSVGDTGQDAIFGLAYDPLTKTLYGSDTIGSDRLYTIDTTTGTATLVGTIGFGNVVGLAFDPNTSTLYGTDSSTDDLITINTTTGAGSSVGDYGTNFMSGLAFDPNTSTLYGTDVQTDRLYTINTSTGAATNVGLTGFDAVGGLAFDPNTNTLYGSDTIDDILITIDTATGEGTDIDSIGFTNVHGLAYDD